MREDDGGEFGNVAIGATVGGLIGGVTSVVKSIKSGESVGKAIAKATVATAVGAVSGAFAASGAPVLTQVAAGGLLGAGQELINQGINGQGCNLVEVAKGTLSGMFGGLLGCSGASYGNKYMSGHVSRFFCHAATDGVKKAGTYLWKMTSTYSKQFWE